MLYLTLIILVRLLKESEQAPRRIFYHRNLQKTGRRMIGKKTAVFGKRRKQRARCSSARKARSRRVASRRDRWEYRIPKKASLKYLEKTFANKAYTLKSTRSRSGL